MLRKIIDGKSVKISQENVYEGVSFTKVTSLQCSDCNFAIKIAHHSTFWNKYRKLAVLKNNILRKKSVVDQLLNKFQPCSTQPSVF